jgi:hypothetical protein
MQASITRHDSQLVFHVGDSKSANWESGDKAWESGDKANSRKVGISGLISQLFGSLAERQNAWLGREDSNLRMVESKSTALPLGDAPTAGTRDGRRPPRSFRSATPVYRGSRPISTGQTLKIWLKLASHRRLDGGGQFRRFPPPFVPPRTFAALPRTEKLRGASFRGNTVFVFFGCEALIP